MRAADIHLAIPAHFRMNPPAAHAIHDNLFFLKCFFSRIRHRVVRHCKEQNHNGRNSQNSFTAHFTSPVSQRFLLSFRAASRQLLSAPSRGISQTCLAKLPISTSSRSHPTAEHQSLPAHSNPNT